MEYERSLFGSTSLNFFSECRRSNKLTEDCGQTNGRRRLKKRKNDVRACLGQLLDKSTWNKHKERDKERRQRQEEIDRERERDRVLVLSILLSNHNRRTTLFYSMRWKQICLLTRLYILVKRKKKRKRQTETLEGPTAEWTMERRWLLQFRCVSFPWWFVIFFGSRRSNNLFQLLTGCPKTGNNFFHTELAEA
jgi:hypothetical protein